MVPEGDKKIQVLSDPTKITKNFIYHRIDLDVNVNTCSFLGRMATLDAIVVKFTPNAFQDPLVFLNSVERDEVIRYKYYLDGNDHFAKEVFKVLYSSY